VIVRCLELRHCNEHLPAVRQEKTEWTA
jgi:hypothetical protein